MRITCCSQAIGLNHKGIVSDIIRRYTLLGPGMCTGVRFGAFELNLRTHELRKQGMRVRVPDQSAVILAMLVERPGEIVTREDIRQRLWSDGTVVEFEHSISSAVARLRDALAESSATPRYIETVPRRGYRFIAAVEKLHAHSNEAADPPRWRHRHPVAAYVSIFALLLLTAGTAAVVWKFRPKGPNQEVAVEVLTRDAGRTTDVAISPDRRMIVYASDRAGNGDLDLWMRGLGGGLPVRLTNDPVDEHEPAFSPDGAQIAFRSEKEGGGIYVMPALGGAPARLVALGRTPRYSPDGRWIAYWVGIGTGKDASQAYVVQEDARRPKRIFSELPAATAPVWSASGRCIAVAHRAQRKSEVWSATFDAQTGTTGPPRPMGFAKLEGTPLFATSIFTSIQWMPDDRFVIYSQLAAGAANIYRVAVAGAPAHISGVPRRLTTGSAKELPLPPNGDLVPFANVTFSLDLWELELDADSGRTQGKPHRLTPGWINDVPSLTPDGSRLAYVSNRFQQGQPGLGGRYAIAIREMASGRESLFTAGFLSPVISPDGRRVVYRGEHGIYSSSLPSLENIQPPELVCPGCGRPFSFSSNGDKLLYRSASGLDALDLTTGRKIPAIQMPPTLYSGGKFSPDNRWIAFNEVTTGFSQIWIAPFGSGTPARSEWVAVTAGNSWDDKPCWSPNGKLLYYISDRDGFRCIWAQPLATGKRPAGPPFAVYHSHTARSYLRNVDPVYAGLEVAPRKMILVNGELAGDLYLLHLPRY